jgi:hypothetical protein
MFRTFNRLVTALVATLFTLAFAARADAQSRPYHATGVAQFAANQSDFTGSGQATHLGHYTEIGQVVFAPTSTPGILAVTGWTRYTAANGSQLYASISGTVDVTTGAIVATATYTGGTGRFSNASGSSSLAGQMLGGGALTISASGSIDY